MPSFPPLTPMATLRWSVVRSVLDEVAPQKVFEVGCGQGGYGARIAARAEYVGVEPDERSCAVARERITPFGGEVINGLSDIVPAERQFDLVCAFEVLEHIEHDADALVDWAGRVRPGGSILLSVPAWQDRFGTMDRLVGHFRRYSPTDLEGLLTKVGFVQIRTTLYGWPLGFALENVRNRIAARRGVASEDSIPDETMAERSATSGRLFQPRRAAGAAVRVGAAPFAQLQKLRPNSGVGLVAVATVPHS